MSNNTTHNNNNNIAEADTDEDDDEFFSNVGFSNEILQRLKQNDPSILGLHIPLRYDENGEYLFMNNIDWKKDGDCISNNTHLKRLYTTYDGSSDDDDGINYILGEEGHNLPTRQQLQDFFSCIYRNSSIKEIIISEMKIDDDFSGGLIEGLSGHTSLTELEICYAGIGSIGYRAIGNILKHPESKLKELRLPIWRGSVFYATQ